MRTVAEGVESIEEAF